MRSKDTVRKIVSMPRWQRDWINDHRSINCSGLVQETLSQIIAEHDPKYYMKNKSDIDIKRKDSTIAFLPKISN
jgi:hypothetical protein